MDSARVIKLSVFLGIPLALIGLAAGWAHHVNSEPVVSIPAPVLPSPNARDDYMRAENLLVDKDGISAAIARPSSRKPGDHVYTLTEKEQLAARNAPALTAMRAGFAHAYFTPPVRSMETRLPELAGFRMLARACRLQADVLAAHGDYNGAVNSGLDAVYMGHDIPRGGPLIHGLVGYASDVIGLYPIWPWIDHLNADQAAAAAQRLEKIEANRYPVSDTLTEEKYLMEADLLSRMRGRNMIQFAVSVLSSIDAPDEPIADKSAKSAKPSPSPSPTPSPSPSPTPDSDSSTSSDDSAAHGIFILTMLRYSKADIIQNYAGYMDASSASAKLPWGESMGKTIPLPSDPLCGIICPVYEKAHFKATSVMMHPKLMIAALALQAYKLRHNGTYPATLDELVQDHILTQLPTDPFGPTNDTPLHYRRLHNGSYQLYSVGPDGKDDHGHPIDNALEKGKGRRMYPEATDKGDWVVGIDTKMD